MFYVSFIIMNLRFARVLLKFLNGLAKLDLFDVYVCHTWLPKIKSGHNYNIWKQTYLFTKLMPNFSEPEIHSDKKT